MTKNCMKERSYNASLGNTINFPCHNIHSKWLDAFNINCNFWHYCFMHLHHRVRRIELWNTLILLKLFHRNWYYTKWFIRIKHKWCPCKLKRIIYMLFASIILAHENRLRVIEKITYECELEKRPFEKE